MECITTTGSTRRRTAADMSKYTQVVQTAAWLTHMGRSTFLSTRSVRGVRPLGPTSRRALQITAVGLLSVA